MKNSFLWVILALLALVSLGIFMLVKQQPLFSETVLMTGNFLMAFLSFGIFLWIRKKSADRPEVFVRSVSGATYLKIFICMIAVLAYALSQRGTLYKPNLFVLFGIYGVYTIAETIVLQGVVRKAK